MKEVTIIPYTYFGLDSGFKEIPVYVVKGNEHPDPARRLTWGYTAEGEFLSSDYNRNFTKAGKPITIKYELSGKLHTASDEEKEKFKAIKEYIKQHEKVKPKRLVKV